MEGPQAPQATDEAWLANGGSRSQVAATHQFSSAHKGPAWLTRRQGDRVEVLSEHGGVAQVFVTTLQTVLQEGFRLT